MERILVVGPKDALEGTIERLHALKAVHLIDYRGEEEGFDLGKPLPKAATLSETLVKLRAVANTLKVERGGAVPAEEAKGDVRERILTLEVNINEEEENRKKIAGLLAELDRQVEERRPFLSLPLSFEDYQGYASLAVLVGRFPGDLEGLSKAVPQHEAFLADGVLALFVPREKEADARDFLARRGFSELPVPEKSGFPREVVAHLEAERKKWRARLEEAEGRLGKLRERYAKFLLAAEDRLDLEVEKAEAPLRFAASEHSFVIDGWVPESLAKGVRREIGTLRGVHVETEAAAIHGGHGHEEAAPEPPVLLKNRGSAKRFEFLIHLFSTPSYKELDPTAFVSLIFPVFFGLMIGDAGYGALWVVFGLIAYAKLKPGAFRDLLFVMMVGGMMALVFGLFVFGEAFGIPFHLRVPSEISAVAAVDPARGALLFEGWKHHAGAELTWACNDYGVASQACLGVNVPLYPLLNKLTTTDVLTMILISVTAALIHLGVGFGFGFVNEWRHSRKHAVAKVGWLIALFGLFGILLAKAQQYCHLPEIGARGHCQYGGFIESTVLFWMDPMSDLLAPLTGGPNLDFFGLLLPWGAILVLLIAVVIIAVTESGLAVMEIAGLLANVISYARLAGIGVAKAATASAFNSVLFAMVLGGDTVMMVVGFFFLFLAQALIFILGAISAGIQAIRLNYVEFFVKFFKGSGTVFRPFGVRTAKEA